MHINLNFSQSTESKYIHPFNMNFCCVCCSVILVCGVLHNPRKRGNFVDDPEIEDDMDNDEDNAQNVDGFRCTPEYY